MINSPEAEKFFDLARNGLIAEQMVDETRETLLKVVRAWVAAERQATQLGAGRRRPGGGRRARWRLANLRGFCSNLVAALDRGLFALLFAAAATLTAYAAFRQAS